jgi:hypothetical protein
MNILRFDERRKGDLKVKEGDFVVCKKTYKAFKKYEYYQIGSIWIHDNNEKKSFQDKDGRIKIYWVLFIKVIAGDYSEIFKLKYLPQNKEKKFFDYFDISTMASDAEKYNI